MNKKETATLELVLKEITELKRELREQNKLNTLLTENLHNWERIYKLSEDVRAEYKERWEESTKQINEVSDFYKKYVSRN